MTGLLLQLVPTNPKILQVSRSQARVLGNASEHARTNFDIVVKREHVIGPTDSFQDPMRSAGLPLDTPANPLQGSQDPPSLGRWPLTHGVTAKTLFI
jgi:hypothetical protein